MKSGIKRILSIVLTAVMLFTTVLSGGITVSAASEQETAEDIQQASVPADVQNQEEASGEETQSQPQENAQAQENEQPQENAQPQENEQPQENTQVQENEQPQENTQSQGTEPEVTESQETEPKDTEDKENTKVSYTFKFTDMKVTVNLEKPESVPEGAALVVKPVFDQTSQAEPDEGIQNTFLNFQALFEKQAAEHKIQMAEYLSYDIRFEKDGNIYRPQGKIHAVLEFNDGLILSGMEKDASNVGVYYLDDKSNSQEILLGTAASDQKSIVLNENGERIQRAEFDTNGFTQITLGTFRSLEEKTEDQENTELVYEDEEVKVTASFAKGTFPADAELKADKVQDENKLQEVEEALNAQVFQGEEQELAGFLAFDIRFEQDGKEIEPDGQVDVSLVFKEAVKAEEKIQSKSAAESSISLYHLKEAADNVTAEEMTGANVFTTEEKQVEKAEFTVDSFSVFVLTWENKSNNEHSNITGTVNIHLVDENQAELVPGEQSYDIKYETNQNNPGKTTAELSALLSEKNEAVKEAIENRHVLRGYVKGENGQIFEFTKLNLWMTDGESEKKKLGFQAVNKNDKYSLVEGDEIYLEYSEKEEPLREIETLSTKSLIDLTVFNYNPDDYSQQQIGGDQKDNPVQGLVETRLVNGMPKSVETGDDLASLFASEDSRNKLSYTDADNLFYKDADGYYYYNSADNYAWFNTDTKQFKVYNWIASSGYGENQISLRSGNFMPFNRITDTMGIFKGYGMDEDGKFLHDLKSGGGDPIDNGFGMKMELQFVQPEGGKINGKNMRFEFNGDDDVFVFIDDKLVLDIGGSHKIAGGYIDFATGDIEVEGVSKTYKTNLRNTMGLETTTLEDWSTHKMSFFYTDRGGASNCKIKFNLVPIPKSGVTIKKEITDIDKGSYSDVDFKFKLYVQDEAGETTYHGQKYAVQRKIKYTLYDSDGITVLDEDAYTSDDGTFNLKHGQMAVFDELADVNKKYFIEETDVSETEYDRFSISGTDITGEDGDTEKLESEQGDGTFIIRSKPLSLNKNVYVNFKNTCAATNLKHLTITKQMIAGQKSNEEFTLDVMIGKQKYRGKYTILKTGVIQSIEDAADGKILLKPGETAQISNIPSGTSFSVTETGLGIQYKAPVYHVEGAEDSKTDGSAAGILKLEENASVTVTNEERFSKLTIRKTIDELYEENGDAIFTFKITGPDNEVFYHTFRFTKDSGKTQEYTFENLPFGRYQVEELPTMRYKVVSEGGTHRTLVLQDEEGETASFTNNRIYEPNYSHTDVVVNRIHIEKGKPESAEKDGLKNKQAGR